MKTKSKSFILFTSLLILVLFSFLSINIIQNKSYSSKINTLKYLELQAEIHLKYIKQQLKVGVKSTEINIHDSRFRLEIIKLDDKKYNIYISHIKEHISLYTSLSLK